MGLFKKLKSSFDVGGLAGSVIGSIGNAVQTRKYLKAQAKENQKNREYNLMLARQQNQWNIEQWQRENDYNSPSAQMARYRQAGLNPDLIYGQQNTSAASPVLTSGVPSSPNDMSAMLSQRNFGTAVQAAINDSLDTKLKKEQIKNIQADTEGKKAGTQKTIKEVEALTIDNLTRAAKNNQDLQIGDTVILVNKSVASMNEQSKNKLIQEIKNLEQVWNLNKQEAQKNIEIIKGLQLDNVEKAKETVRRDKRLNAELRKFYDDHKQALVNLKISEQELSEMIATYPFRLAGLQLQNKQTEATIKKLGLDNIRMDFENDKLEVQTDIYRNVLEYDSFGDDVLQMIFYGLELIPNIFGK
ncbi:hypothetical protein [Coprobacter secundus]|uniref:hypothetical protein n=1 Tax=Coprobacter secundus TaxID=1501392 RepID=UPI0022E49547|nr:hypothetical protein [Coprobacter secundus]